MAAFCFVLAFVAFPSKQSFGEIFDVPGDRAQTIGEAVRLAERSADSSNVIEVATGNYTESLTVWEGLNVTKSLTIRGKEGAKVLIRAASSEALITIQGAASDVVLERLILKTAGKAIQINTSGRVFLRNLVIIQASTAVDCSGTTASGTTINHVTFYQVTNGVNCPSSPITITNNIFSTIAGTPIAPFSVSGATVQFNLFWACTGPEGTRGTDLVMPNVGDDLNPQFVDTNNDDFHVQEGSAAINKAQGGEEDVGAYGGLVAAASVPFPPDKPTVSCGDPNATTCKVTWKRNLDYSVDGYVVHSSAPSAPNPNYGTTTQVTNLAGGCAVSSTPPPVCTGVVGSLPDTGTTPSDPSAPSARFGDSKVQLSWPAVTGATTYEVYVETDSNLVGTGTPDFTVSSPAWTVENLTNGIPYYFAVRAVNQPTFYAAVTSIQGDFSGTATLKVSELSVAADPKTYGTASSSNLSPTVSATPQPVVGFPPLEDNGGCFIATAAYGSSLAPQVDVLRAFREHYLRPYRPGRAVIRLYETWSPPLADVIRTSDTLRMAIRAMLWPVVGSAWIAVYGPWWMILLIAGVAIAMMCVLMKWRGVARA
ncbi:MAG: CFI-box-CTERM domain-containing protein [Nitrospirota bacterium]